MKTKLLRCVTGLLFGVGTLILAYPFVSSRLVAHKQTVAIQSYGLSVADMNDRQAQAQLEKAREYNALLRGTGIADPFLPESGYILPEAYRSILNIDGVIGFLDIPAIRVNIPIYHGTDESTLKKGVGHLRSTAFPIGGEGNHAVLTGHRGLSSAKLFTDLDQLTIGDVFTVTVLQEKLAYQVDQIRIVAPSDTQELLPAKGKDYVTLITCTPYGINSHRLFVRAHRVDFNQTGGETKPLHRALGVCLFAAALPLSLQGITKRSKRGRRS